MVAYIASQTLTHNKIVVEEEQGANIWDILTQRVPSQETQAIAPLWDIVEEQGEDTVGQCTSSQPSESTTQHIRRGRRRVAGERALQHAQVIGRTRALHHPTGSRTLSRAWHFVSLSEAQDPSDK